MDIKNFKTVLSDEKTRERITNYALVIDRQLKEFALKEMKEYSISYQEATNRFFVFKLAEEAYRKHLDAVASEFYSIEN